MRLINTLIAITVAAFSAAADDYDATIAAALTHSHNVRADSLRGIAAVAEIRAENTLEGPEAEFEYLIGPAGVKNRWSAGLTQSFDWPGAYRARSRQANATRLASEEVLRSVVLDKALQVKLLIIDIVNARQRAALNHEIVAAAARLDSLTRRSFELGNATVLDTRKAALAALDARRRLADVENDCAALDASLQALIGRATCTAAWTKYPEQTTVSEDMATDDFPEVRVASLSLAAARAAADAVRASSLPGFSLGYRHAFEDGTHFNGFTVGVRLPSWSRKQRTLSARLEAESAAEQLAQTRLDVVAQYTAELTSARRLAALRDEYQGLASDDSYLPLLQRAFDGGQISVLDFISEIDFFRQARVEYLDLDYRLQLALARLNRSRSPFFQ